MIFKTEPHSQKNVPYAYKVNNLRASIINSLNKIIFRHKIMIRVSGSNSDWLLKCTRMNSYVFCAYYVRMLRVIDEYKYKSGSVNDKGNKTSYTLAMKMHRDAKRPLCYCVH